jgi:hypothetical protein
MKRMSLLLGIVAFAAISAPLAAQGNGGKYGRAGSGVYDTNGDGRIDSRDQVNSGCSWWEVNCSNTRTNGRIGTNRSGNDSGWYRIGTDRAGNSIYERDTYERNGRETIEIARQDRNGHLKVIDKQHVDNRQNNGRIYDNRGRRGDGEADDRQGRGR